MSKRTHSARYLTLAAIVAALYTVLGYFGNIFGLTGGVIQIRFAEALTVLPFLFPGTAPGLAVGCFLANLLGSPFMLDWVFGTLATLLAALWTRKMPNKWLAALPPVLCNAVIVGAEIAYFTLMDGGAFWAAYGLNALTVGLGECIACFALGIPLVNWLAKTPIVKKSV